MTPTSHSASGSFDYLRRAFRATFSLLILINRAASSYQLLDLNLAVFPLDGLFLIADLLSFEVDVLVSSFLDNAKQSTAPKCALEIAVAIDSSPVRPEAQLPRLLD
jgi:hypothetical protein